MSVAKTYCEAVECVTAMVAFGAAWWHLDCDAHWYCLRLPMRRERYCAKHRDVRAEG